MFFHITTEASEYWREHTGSCLISVMFFSNQIYYCTKQKRITSGENYLQVNSGRERQREEREREKRRLRNHCNGETIDLQVKRVRQYKIESY